VKWQFSPLAQQIGSARRCGRFFTSAMRQAVAAIAHFTVIGRHRLLGWMVLHFVQDKLVLSVTGSLIMLSASFFTGSFIGFMAGTVNRV
jgi:hypothetical protein